MKKEYRELIKFIFVGIWNTIFGILLYTGAILLFGEKHYLLLGVLCNIIAITQTYFMYKFIVFKTKGNYLREYFRMYITYINSMVVGLILMYVMVTLLKINAIYANIIATLIIALFNFLMHKLFTFKSNK